MKPAPPVTTTDRDASLTRLTPEPRAGRADDPRVRHGYDEPPPGGSERAAPGDDLIGETPGKDDDIVGLPLEERRRRQHRQVVAGTEQVVLSRIVVHDERQCSS